MRYTIAINSYQNPEMLARCLRYAQKAIKGEDAEIIVADGETQEETREMMREDFSDIRFFPHKNNIGMGALANIGLKEARGEYIFLINYDCIIDKESIQILAHHLEHHDDVGIVGPKVLNYDGSLQNTCYHFYTPLTVLYRRTPLGKLPFAKKHLKWFSLSSESHKKPFDVDWIMGSALMVRKNDVKKIGLFDSRFFMYFEDTDWCRRFWEHGMRVVCVPRARVYHLHGKGSARGGLLTSLLFNKLTWIHINSAWKYFFKYGTKPHPRKQ
jgi:N-acetylglucosaminyl-diphospho-decaprenol L-rhamnosyltransferase